MYTFNYHVPDSLENAIARARDSEDAQFLAGGMTVLPAMKLRLSNPSDLINLDRVPGLGGIEFEKDAMTIGAMTRHAEVAVDPELRRRCPALASLAGVIGDPQVRNRGTIGGSLATNHPSADYPAAVLGLDATISTNTRSIGGGEFFNGMFETVLETGELITAVTFRQPDAAVYEKFRDPASRYALVGVFVARFGNDVRVAVTGVGECVFRVDEFENALTSRFEPDALNGLSVAAADLLDDLQAGADYRAHLVGILARRAVARICDTP